MATADFSPTILLFGAGGQLGREILVSLSNSRVIGTVRQSSRDYSLGACRVAEIQDHSTVESLLDELQPSLVINAAAYTAVDHAEKEQELAFEVNGHAVGRLAQLCAARNIPLIHYSTDYVFDGSGTAPWNEDSAAAPLNAYGRSKLLGEELIRAANPPHLIMRTSWVYGAHGHNFVKTMLKLGRERTELRVVDDQIGAPTSARALAEVTARIIAEAGRELDDKLRQRGGILHVACRGKTSWHGFAEEIFRLARSVGWPLKVERVVPIASSEYPTPAERPLNSRLDCSKFERNFGLMMPAWQEALAGVFPEIRQTFE